jgi:peptidoglycan/LPS O-acetylase OafA/YrhL
MLKKSLFNIKIENSNYIPELDGLRFFTVFGLVLYHIGIFYSVKYTNLNLSNNSFFYFFLTRGNLRVRFFFVLSGFLLGGKFAKYYLSNGNPVNLKKYFISRLTRIEPSFIIVMFVLLLGYVYVDKSLSLTKGLESFFLSIFHIHNIVYPDVYPLLNGSTWSLEIDVQFYLLMPLIAYVFVIKSNKFRRLLMVFLTLFFIFVNQHELNPLKFRSIVGYFQYFMVGILLSDLYVTKSIIISKTKFDNLIGLLCFVAIHFFVKSQNNPFFVNFIFDFAQVICIFLIFYYILNNNIFKFLKLNLFRNLGAISYSVFLIHYPIISLFGNPLIKISLTDYEFFDILIYSIIIILLVFLFSAIFYLLIERPFMNNKWRLIFNSRKPNNNI